MYFKKYVALTVVYFVLISVPLQIMQYFTYTVAPIVRTDWWLQPGSSPPLFVPLTQFLATLSSSMSQFRLYDTSQVVYAIAGQLTWSPNFNGRTFAHALYAIPRFSSWNMMFVVIVVGLALAHDFLHKNFCQGSGPLALATSFSMLHQPPLRQQCSLFF